MMLAACVSSLPEAFTLMNLGRFSDSFRLLRAFP